MSLASRPADPGSAPPTIWTHGIRRNAAKSGAAAKSHLTETCTHPGAPAAPNLITNVATTMAAVPDAAMTEPVHGMLAAAGLTPGEHAADAGYAGADLLLDARARGITLLAPLAVPSSPQARAGGYTADMFTIDWNRQQVTCPQGALSRKWSASRDGFSIGFPAATCRACPARDKCTTSARQGRQMFLRPREIHEAVTALRASQGAQEWKDCYAIRAGVEGTIRQATAVTGIRTARYRGLPKNQPRARRRRHRHQPDPPRRLVHQQTTRPDPHHSPPAAQPRRLKPQ